MYTHYDQSEQVSSTSRILDDYVQLMQQGEEELLRARIRRSSLQSREDVLILAVKQLVKAEKQ